MRQPRGRWLINASYSNVLQQLVDNPCPHRLHAFDGGLVVSEHRQELPHRDSQQPLRRHDLLRTLRNLYFVLLGLVYPSHLLYDILRGWRSQQTSHRHKRPRLLRCAGHIWQRVGYHYWVRQRHRVCVGQNSPERGGQDVFANYTTHERELSEQQGCELVERLWVPDRKAELGLPSLVGEHCGSRINCWLSNVYSASMVPKRYCLNASEGCPPCFPHADRN